MCLGKKTRESGSWETGVDGGALGQGLTLQVHLQEAFSLRTSPEPGCAAYYHGHITYLLCTLVSRL